MRHRLEGRKFGREKAHRTSLFRNLVKSMIVSPHGRIETTEAKAKSLRSYVERLITYAKKDTVASRRQAYSVLGNRTLVKKLFEEVAPPMQDRRVVIPVSSKPVTVKAIPLRWLSLNL